VIVVDVNLLLYAVISGFPQLGTAGNLTTDVQLAALALELDAELHSNDSVFGRFKALHWINPLD